MSKRFLSPLRLVNLASDPVAGSEGDVYWNTADEIIKIYNGITWSPVGGSMAYVLIDGGSASSTFVASLDGGGA